MKFSENWLREWVNPAVDTEQLTEQLTMAGLEVDGVEPALAEFSGVVVGEITEAVQHPDADKLRVCTVNTGNEVQEIVCGAPNARAGIKVACAKVGAKLPGNFKIKKAKLRGVVSMGMLCSESELKLSEESDGILELPQDAPVGLDFRDYLNAADNCIDVDLTPNKGDCFSIRGIAREVAVINELEQNLPEINAIAASSDEQLPVALEAPEACPRYVGRIIKGIDASASTPLWMVEKLRRSGIRAIHPVVDITNYVMLELGQPMHAFDLREVSSGIVVRYPQADEKLVLLDGREVELSEDTLIIANKEQPLALAGIMGGEHSGIADDTTDIFLECAWFNPLAIVGKARQYGLHTDASARYERGVDYQLQVTATERATALILEICGGTAATTVDTKVDAHLPTAKPIALRRARIERLLGIKLEDSDIKRILTALEMQVSDTDEGWQVTAPSHRFDIAIEADLIEEVARVYGYNNMPMKKSHGEMVISPLPENQVPVAKFKQTLVNRGFQEAITYSFVDPKLQQRMFPDAKVMSLLNPISSDMADMRVSLLPGLVQALSHNQNQRESQIRLFETGLRFIDVNGELAQQPMIAGLINGDARGMNWEGESRSVDFYDLKADVEALIALTGAEHEFSFETLNVSYMHPGQSAKVLRNGQEVGVIGAIHPSISSKLKLSGSIIMFELSLELLQQATIPSYQPWSKYPSSTRDIAVIVDESVSADDLLETVQKTGGSPLSDVRIFDIYRGKGVDLNRKSVALSLTFSEISHTLKDTEVTLLVEKIVDQLSNQFAATLRE